MEKEIEYFGMARITLMLSTSEIEGHIISSLGLSRDNYEIELSTDSHGYVTAKIVVVKEAEDGEPVGSFGKIR